MNITDPGFILLLLPTFAAFYYCCPKRFRTAAICLISGVGVFLLEPSSAFWILASVFFDAAASLFVERTGNKSAVSYTFYLLAMIKDVSVIVFFGIMRPLISDILPSASLLVVHFTLLCSLVAVRRKRVEFSSPLLFFANAVTLGRLPFGPAADPERLLPTLKEPQCSFKKVGEGIFLVIFGCAKRILLSEQLFALYKTLMRIPEAQMSVASAWLAALCPAMGICFVFSAYSDIAQGIGMIFGIDVPRMAYYPFQAKGVRESVYRLNMSLEDSVGRLIFSSFSRESRSLSSVIASLATPFALAVLIGLGEGTLLWALWLSVAVGVDMLIQEKVKLPPMLLRLSALVFTLPAYSLLTGTASQRLAVLTTMFGLSGGAFIDSTFFYHITSNIALLICSVLLCSSLLSTLLLMLRKKSERLWWGISFASSVPIMVVTASFMIRNVR